MCIKACVGTYISNIHSRSRQSFQDNLQTFNWIIIFCHLNNYKSVRICIRTKGLQVLGLFQKIKIYFFVCHFVLVGSALFACSPPCVAGDVWSPVCLGVVKLQPQLRPGPGPQLRPLPGPGPGQAQLPRPGGQEDGRNRGRRDREEGDQHRGL